VETQAVEKDGETVPPLHESHEFVLRQRVFTSERDLNVIWTLLLFPSVMVGTMPWAWISALFWIHDARAGWIPSSFAEVCQVQLRKYVVQWNASASRTSPPLRRSRVLAEVA
jgi:hypothetical protein